MRRSNRLCDAYHIERSRAARQGLHRYHCACERCHGLKIQSAEVVQIHHRKYGRDFFLQDPVVGLCNLDIEAEDEVNREAFNTQGEDAEFIAEEFDEDVDDVPDTDINFEEMARNCFS